MYQQNKSDMFTNAVDIEQAQTLSVGIIPAARFAGAANTSANLPANATAVAYPSIGATGGTYLGSARPSTRGPGSGEQNDAIGVSYTLTTDGAGAVNSVTVNVTRPNGIPSPIVAAPSAPLNPGAGPNIGFSAQTIIFDTASLNAAFGIQNPAVTGLVTITLTGAEFQVPLSGTVAAGPPITEQVYEADPQSGGSSFDIYVGTAGIVRLELVGAPTNQFVLINAGIGPMNLQARKVYLGAATTAAGLLALY